MENYRLVSEEIQSLIAQHLEIPIDSIRLNEIQMQLSSNASLLPFHTLLIQSPFDSVDLVNRLAQNLQDSSYRFDRLINNASILLNQRIGLIDVQEWPSSTDPVEEFLLDWADLYQQQNAPVDPNQRETLRSLYLDLPPSLQIILTRFLQALSQANGWMALGRQSIASIQDLHNLERILCQRNLSPSEWVILEKVSKESDRKAIFRASAELCAVLSTIIEHPIGDIDIEQTLVIPTPFGDILIAGQGDDIHTFTHAPLLLIDCGGNDTYSGIFAQSGPDRPFSVVIDWNGQDRYLSETEPFGASCGLFGFSGLIDLGPQSDRYEGKSRCFGYSLYGVALLYDEQGDSSYQAESLCLGASEAGISFLIDREGNDTYQAFSESQGYGALGGFGLLHDSTGNDRYIASATPVVNPSAQLPEQNLSASQGFGTGRFGPTSDGRSMPGGIGILLDGEGDDRYEASVFAQGSGWGFGIGILADQGGNDQYRASWYAMGSAAHQGCGFLIDARGDDNYQISHYMMGGAATDFSLGVFADLEGDDWYHAQNSSWGFSLANSFAQFLDGQGNDHYRLEEQSGAGLAQNELANTFRGLWPTYGIFIDLSGLDQYIDLSPCSNNHCWNRSDKNLDLHALGIDCEAWEND